MGKSFGGSIKLQGESEYRRALAGINTDMRVLGSELKAVAAEFDANDRSVENLSKQNVVLNKQIDEQEKKVRTLRQALSSAKEETGEESATTKKWQTDLNNAQAELNKLNRQLKANEHDMNAAQQETDDERKSLEKLGASTEDIRSKFEALGKGIKASFAVAAAATAAVSAAFVGIGKQAITLYADYEQLIGGVETLFGKSADQVKQYANNAFTSAGLSANEYMETVTGFSASLIQSLGGDTEKAAKMADMAITDMSDNANKMGSDLASIQSAYQGFAKQNYTMLDNLKLGYGGTKTEMERLLKDAQAISGIEYDVSSYADIVDAIHVIQSEMGITGTTAKEASSTISGSLSAMKSAWQNLLVGVADDGRDFDTLIENMVGSVVTFGENIIPRIRTTISGIGMLFKGFSEELLPELVDMVPGLLNDLLPAVSDTVSVLIDSVIDILPGLLDVAVTKVIPKLITTTVTSVKKLVTAISAALPGLMRSLSSALVDLAAEIFSPKNITETIDIAIGCVKSIIEGVQQSLPILIEGVFQLINGLIEALPEIIDLIVNEIPNIIDTLCNTLLKSLPALINGVIKMIDGIVAALPQIIKSIVDALPRIITSVIDALTTLIPALVDGAISIVMSLVQHLPEIISALIDAIPQIISAIFDPDTGFLSASNIGKLVQGVADAVVKIFENIPAIVTGLIDAIPQIISAIFDSNEGFLSKKNIDTLVKGAVQIVAAIVARLPEIISSLLTAIPGIVSSIVSATFSAISGALEGILGNVPVIGGLFKPNEDYAKYSDPEYLEKLRQQPSHKYSGGSNTNSVAKYATGGVVTQPTFGVFGEDGAEAIVPLERNTQWIDRVAERLFEANRQLSDMFSSAYNTAAIIPAASAPVNINIQFGDVQMASDMDIRDVADQISQVLTQDILVKGGGWS